MSKNNFHIPESFLKELNEFSGGGFILFTYDQESNPKVYASFDSAAHGLGMQKFMQNWLSLVDTVNLESSMQEISDMGEDEDEDYGGEDSSKKT